MPLKSPLRGIQSRRRMYEAALGNPPTPIFKFDPALTTFTPGMAKRAGTVFAGAPIVQGDWEQGGAPTGDGLYFPRGNLIGNQVGHWYDNFDPYQGTIVMWVALEGATTGSQYLWIAQGGNDYRAHYVSGDNAIYARFGNQLLTVPFTPAVGVLYCLVFSWDVKNAIDGTNYARGSVNDAHTFGITTQPTVEEADATIQVFCNTAARNQLMGIGEGLHIFRRPLYDGAYGQCMTYDDGGPVDEIAAIYAAGAGADPCLITGSWDCVFGLPTDAVPGALVTGPGEAWSHPHNLNILAAGNAWMQDGGYLGGEYAPVFDGATAVGNCGNDVTLRDIPAGGNIIQVESWFRCDAAGGTDTIISKGAGGIGGWGMTVLDGGQVRSSIDLATADCNADSPADGLVRDGKFHHAVLSYNDTTKSAQTAVDGRWGTANVGVGAYITDVPNTLFIGQLSSGGWFFEGAIGWTRIWGAAHYTPGTDFVAPRTPPAIGAAVEGWLMNEGTGNSIAQVTTPNNDCVLANHTWEPQWNQELTPVVPYSVEFDGAATLINCESGVTIDDLHDAAMTAEAWVRADGYGESDNGYIFEKGALFNGWRVEFSGGEIVARILCATTVGICTVAFVPDGRQHHIAMTWDDAWGNTFPRLWIDGVEATYGFTQNRNGLVNSDAASDFIVGNRANGANTFDGGIAWARLSDSIRYTDTFIPPSRLNPPAPDGNTMAQWNFRDGAGATLTDSSDNANHGTITFGTGRWYTTPDMVVDAPGQRIFPWGYCISGTSAILAESSEEILAESGELLLIE